MKSKVLLGLSGGVDSAVAAALLQADGLEVTGLFLHNGSMCADADLAAARAVSCDLGIDLRVRDIRQALEEKVARPFAEEYLRGRTPNPCVLCNPLVKYAALLAEAEALGAELVATGHYANLRPHPAGIVLLWDDGSPKDQSYMLARLSPELLSRCRFPLGGRSKEEIRALACEMGISVAERPDSMEICFVPDNDYAAFVEKVCGAPPPGDFVDTEGRVLGRHQGIHRYTVGQRKGLGIALGYPAYVSRIDAAQNRVVLSAAGGEYRQEAALSDCLWHLPLPESFTAAVKVRHTKRPITATVIPDGSSARLRFSEPCRAPAPGQLAAILVEGFVIGCGCIEDS